MRGTLHAIPAFGSMVAFADACPHPKLEAPMRLLVPLACWLLAPALAQAQEFMTQASKDAAAAYEADLAAARAKYTAALDHAALKAVEMGDLEEVVRIKDRKTELVAQTSSVDADPLVRARQRVQGTKWSWTSTVSGRNSSGVEFLTDGRIKLSGVDIGAWAMAEPDILVMRTDDGLWLMKFDKNYERYIDIRNYKLGKHNIVPGKRVSPPIGSAAAK